MRDITRVIGFATLVALASVSTGTKSQQISPDSNRSKSSPQVLAQQRVKKLLAQVEPNRSLWQLRASAILKPSELGQWEGWIGSPELAGTTQRCSVTISKGTDGTYAAIVVTKSLGMTVSGRQVAPNTTDIQVFPLTANMLAIKTRFRGHEESVAFTLTRRGSISYLTGTDSQGRKYQLWRGNAMNPATPAVWG